MKILAGFLISITLIKTVFSLNDLARNITQDDKDKNDDPDFPFTTVVDILSQNVEFSMFLRLIQRQGFIPYLNELQNFTLFVPVNSAFVTTTPDDYQLDIEKYLLHGYILNTEEFIPGIHILPEEEFPLMLKKSSKDSSSVNDIGIVEPNLFPNSQDAVVQGIGAFIGNLPSYQHLIYDLNSKSQSLDLVGALFNSTFASNLRLETILQNKTIFLPVDANFLQYFNQVELDYLTGTLFYDEEMAVLKKFKHSKEWLYDKLFLIKKLAVEGFHGGILPAKDLTNMNGEILEFHTEESGALMVINGSNSVYSNLVYDKGVVHTFQDLDFLGHGISFNAEKYLLGLNCFHFVKELYVRNLQHLIIGEDYQNNITIFVPEDSGNDLFGLTRSGLLYHFTESHIWLEEDFNRDGQQAKLYDSMFCSSNRRLGGQCQKLRISKTSQTHKSGFQYLINGRYQLKQTDPYVVGNALIYMVRGSLDLPGDLIPSINPFYHCSKSLFFLQQLNLLELKPNNKGYTIFLPCFDSWDFLDLNLNYLERNVTALNLVMKNFIVDGLVYTDFSNVTMETTNLYNESITLHIGENDLESSELELSLSTLSNNISLEKDKDIIFNQGVIHPLKRVTFPQSLEISLRNLIDTTGSIDFLMFMEKFKDFSEILEHNGPYSLLVPTPKSLLMEGIDLNSTRLEDFLKLHTIPMNSTEALLNCDGQINTTLDESLICREVSSTCFLQVKNGLDKEVRVLKKGCTSFDNKSCVFVIDRPISLQWLNREKYHLKLPGVAFGIGIILGALFIVGLLLCTLMGCIGKRILFMSYRNESDPEERDEERSLIASSSSPQSNSYSSTVRSSPNSANDCRNISNSSKLHNFENSYSTNSKTTPIQVSQAFSKNVSREDKRFNIPNMDVAG